VQNYIPIHGDKLHRRLEDILLTDDLRNFLSIRHSDLTATETEKIISRLQNIPSSPLYNGNRETFLLVNEGFDLQRDEPGKLALHVNYIDFETPENNSFKVINQFSIQGERLRRPGLLLFIIGIPNLLSFLKKEETVITC
jgi:type I restriction enzyme R subunit